MAAERWVAVRLSAMGDVVLTTGVLDFWHRKRGWRFVMVTREALAPIFKTHPAVDEVVCLDDEELEFPRNLGRFKELAARYSDCGLLDMHGSLRSRMLSALWKGKVRRYHKLGLERRLFLLSGHKLYGGQLLEYNVPQRFAMAVDNPPPEQEMLIPRIYLDENELNEASRLLQARGISADKPLVALHPYATHAQKSWPVDYWRRLIFLLEAEGLGWFVVGQAGKAVLRQELPETRERFDFTNETALRVTCALLAHAKLLVSADSGPMHLGTGVGVPVLGLFGPTTRHWGFFPSGKKDRIIEADCPGRPYSLHGKSSNMEAGECMRLISPELVLANILSQINS